MITKFITFLRWLLASETLPTVVVPDGSRGGVAPKQGIIRWILQSDTFDTTHSEGEVRVRGSRLVGGGFAADPPKRAPRFWSWLVRPEVLSHGEGELNPLEVRTMFLRRLIAPEVCPEQRGVAAARHVGVVRRLLGSEQCPSHPVRALGRKKNWLGRVLEAEHCPVDPWPISPRRRGFLRTLLTPEEL